MHFVTLLVVQTTLFKQEKHLQFYANICMTPRSLSKSKAQAPKSITRADLITAISSLNSNRRSLHLRLDKRYESLKSNLLAGSKA